MAACHWRFPEMLIASLRLLAQQDLTHLSHLVIAFDAPRGATLEAAARRMAAEFPHLRPSFVYQSPLQARILKAINWGWVDCWLSYSKGIAEVSTRHVMLHDMDAMLIRPGIVEERYAIIRERGDQFLGYKWYLTNGIVKEDRLVVIVEMMFDAEFLRSKCRPIDLFNRIAEKGADVRPRYAPVPPDARRRAVGGAHRR